MNAVSGNRAPESAEDDRGRGGEGGGSRRIPVDCLATER
jgi:hypothetical protein